jgi:multifunctional beta-oxidation protein
MLGNFTAANEEQGSDADPYTDPEDPESIARAKGTSIQTGEYNYSERDVILYNLGIGATEQDLQWTFENHDHFTALPTFGVIPQFSVSFSIPFDFLANYNPVCWSFRHQNSSIVLTAGVFTGKASAWRTIPIYQKGHPH